MTKKRRLLSGMMAVMMTMSMLPTSLIVDASAAAVASSGGVKLPIKDSQWTEKIDVSSLQGEKTLQGGAKKYYKLSGTGDQPVKISGTGAIVALAGVAITSESSPIQLEDGASATIVLMDGTQNTLACEAFDIETVQGMTAGIHVPKTASLTIDKPQGGEGNGSLTVTGGDGGAGIGGKAGVGYSTENSSSAGNKGEDGGKVTAYWTNGGYGAAQNKLATKKTTHAPMILDLGTPKEYVAKANLNLSQFNQTGLAGKTSYSEGNHIDFGAASLDWSIGQVVIGLYDGYEKDIYNMSPKAHTKNANGTGGNGGEGGAYGSNGGDAGSITINSGTVFATGGQGAAGIGGGAGADGEAGKAAPAPGAENGASQGAPSKTASKSEAGIISSASWLSVGDSFSGEAGGGGAGGNGGNGGNGGSATQVTITGGQVTATAGGDAAQDIGGGAGGQGGQGGAGAAGAKGRTVDYSRVQLTPNQMVQGNGGIGLDFATRMDRLQHFDGGTGATGFVGLTGSGGAMGNITISGGQVNANLGKKSNAPETQPNGDSSRNKTDGKIALHNFMTKAPLVGTDDHTVKEKVIANHLKMGEGGTNTKDYTRVKAQQGNYNYGTDTTGLDVDQGSWTWNLALGNTSGSAWNISAEQSSGRSDDGLVTSTGQQSIVGGRRQSPPRIYNVEPWSGDGGTAASVTPSDDIRTGSVKVKTEDQHTQSFLQNLNPTQDGIRPKNNLGDDLYMVRFKVIAGSNGNVAAPGTKVSYVYNQRTYSTVVDGEGYAKLWLPVGNHSIPRNSFAHTEYGVNASNVAANVTTSTTNYETNRNNYISVYLSSTGERSITVTGVETDGSKETTLYTNQNKISSSITQYNQGSVSYAGKIVTDCKVYEVSAAGVETDKTATLAKFDSSTKTVALDFSKLTAGTSVKVKFIYSSKMTNVTIKACYAGTNTQLKDFAEYKVPMEIGSTVQGYPAPQVTGYTCTGNNMTNGSYTVVKDGSITFYYKRTNGNVVYQAVLDNTDPPQVLWYKYGNVNVNDTINTEANVPPTDSELLKSYERKPKDTAKVAYADGTTLANNQYTDPAKDVFVTYTYVRKAKTVEVVQVDADTKQVIPNSTKVVERDVPLGAYKTFKAPEPKPDGYELVGESSQTVMVDSTTTQIKFYYKRPGIDASKTTNILIKMYASAEDKAQDKPFASMQAPGVYDVESTVNAPLMTGWTLKDGETNPVQVTPVKSNPESAVVKFIYNKDLTTIKVVAKLKDTGNAKIHEKSYAVQKGTDFTALAPYVTGYKLAANETVSKTVKAGDTTTEVVFLYDRLSAADFVTVKVIGVGPDNNEQKPLYSYEKQFPVQSGEKKITAFTQPKMVVASATVDGTTAAMTNADASNGVGVKEVTVNVDASKQAGDTIKVVFTYKSNMATVTINKKDNTAAHNPLPDQQPITVEAEINSKFTYTAPAIADYVNKGTSHPDGITVQENGNVIDFYYEKAPVTGNVQYVAVDKDNTNTILAYGITKQLKKGDAVEKDLTKISEYFPAGVTNFQVVQGQTPSATIADGSAVTAYDGKNNITVKFTFERKTKTITIKCVDADTGKEIPQNSKATAEVKMGVSTNLTEKAPNITGYNKLDGQVLTITAADNTSAEEITVFYRKANNQSSVVVKLYAQDEGNRTLINSYTVPGITGTTGTITAPDLSGQGYISPAQNTHAVVFGTDTEKEFIYTIQWHTVTVNVGPEGAKNALPADYAQTQKVRHGTDYTVIAPDIPGYTLTSQNAVTKFNSVTENKTVQLTYAKTEDLDYVKHQVIGVISKNGQETEVFNYTNNVSKNANSTTYYAPIQEGYVADKLSVTKLNNANATGANAVKFIYTENGAKIIIKHVNNNGTLLRDVADDVRTGYKVDISADKNHVTINAPVVQGYTCVGVWNGSALDTTKKSVLHTLTVGDNVVSFAYEKLSSSDVTFTLTDADTGDTIRVVKGQNGQTYTAESADFNLATMGYTFQKEGSTDPFDKDNGSVQVNANSGQKDYVLKYKKATRPVTYEYKDVTNPAEPKNITFTDNSNTNPTTARVLEKFEAYAPHISGYAVSGTVKQMINSVANETGALIVTFNYVKKSDATITVEHKVKGENNPFSSYTVNVSDGEWFTASALTDTKYTLNGSKNTQTIQANATQAQTITFEYDKNYVTVKTFTNTDGTTDDVYQPGIEVVKKQGTALTPPVRTGYVLKGIKVVTKAQTDTAEGSNTTYPQNWDEATSTLTLSNLTKDTEVYYYYKTIQEAIPENQVTITVIEKHETFEMSRKTHTVVKEREVIKNHTYAPNTYEDYQVKTYQVDQETVHTIEGTFSGAQVDHNVNHTITYTFVRKDNGVAVPGKDDKLPSGDDVVVKPGADGQKPAVDGNGTVTVPNGAEVVTPNGTVVPPNGSKVEKDGTIKTPENKVIDPSDPGKDLDPKYIFVKYNANGGKGAAYSQIALKADGITIKSVAELKYTKNGFTADIWNTNEMGYGTDYAASQKVNDSLTLFAKWNTDTTHQYKYTATITLHSNSQDAMTQTQTIGSDTTNQISEKIMPNPFTVNNWTFKGWNTAKDGSGTYYAGESAITLEDKHTINLYAQWVKYGEDGSMTVPGTDLIPETETDNVVAKPGNTGKLDRNDTTGVINVPNGGTAKKDNKIFYMPNGGSVKPDGTITIKLPDGSNIVVKPDGNVENLPEGTILITYTSDDPALTVEEYGTAANGVTVRSDVFSVEGKTLKGWTKDGVAVAFGTKLKENATLKAKWSINGTTVPTVGDKVKLDDQTKEYILVLRGEWKNEKTHELKATIDGKAAPAGSVSWRVKNDSYKNEFGFKGSMTGNDIVEVTDAVTGAIKVRNSGIVRVECVSNATQQVVCSVVVIVPGDVNRDGGVMSDDASLVMDAELNDALFPAFDLNNHETWFWNIMADMNANTHVQSDDADFILDLDLGTLEI